MVSRHLLRIRVTPLWFHSVLWNRDPCTVPIDIESARSMYFLARRHHATTNQRTSGRHWRRHGPLHRGRERSSNHAARTSTNRRFAGPATRTRAERPAPRRRRAAAPPHFAAVTTRED